MSRYMVRICSDGQIERIPCKGILKLQGDVGNLYHLAEEIADARIMLDQMELAFDLTKEIREWDERKLRRLQGMVEDHG